MRLRENDPATGNDDREKEMERKRRRREERAKEKERERSVDPDPVTEAGDGTTKSNPPSKIESCRGSVYLMKEKRRQRLSHPHKDQEGRPRRKTE